MLIKYVTIFNSKITKKVILFHFFVNELKENFQWVRKFFQYLFSEMNPRNSCKKPYLNVWLLFIQKKQIFQKARHFLTSKTEHSDDLLRLNTKHPESLKTNHTESLLCPKTTIPNLYYIETDDTDHTEHSEAFLRWKPKLPKTSQNLFVVFVRSSQLGMFSHPHQQFSCGTADKFSGDKVNLRTIRQSRQVSMSPKSSHS